MNKLTIAFGVLVVLIGGFFIFNSYIYHEKQADEVSLEAPQLDVYLDQFDSPSVEIAFDYLSGPDGYVIDDLSAFIGEDAQGAEVLKVYRIMNAKEKVELENSEVVREGPPTIQLMVFRNERNQSASMWVDAFPVFSNIDLVRGEVDRDAVVGDVKAVRYTTDGLYLSDNAVVAHSDYIYHFIGSYLEPDSVIHQDFKDIINSVRFISRIDTGVQVGAKIDVRVACESALAYMLFQTGEQSNKFIEECINGEHPDVIERYINDMGLDGAAI